MSRDGFAVTGVSKLDLDKINTLGRVMQKISHNRDHTILNMHSDILSAMHIDMITAVLLRVDQTGLINLINFEFEKRESEELFFDDEDPKSGAPSNAIVTVAAAQLQFIYKTIIRPLQTLNARLSLLGFPTVLANSATGYIIKTDTTHLSVMQFKAILDYYEACLAEEGTYPQELDEAKSMIGTLVWSKSFCPAMPLTKAERTPKRIEDSRKIIERLTLSTLYSDTPSKLGRHFYSHYFDTNPAADSAYHWPRLPDNDVGASESKGGDSADDSSADSPTPAPKQ